MFIKSTSRLDYFSYSKNSFLRTEILSPIYHTNNENDLFLTSKNDGVFIFNTENFQSLNLKFDPRNPLSISSSNFDENQNQALLIVDENLWIGTSYGLNKYNLSTNLNKRFYETQETNTLNSNYINDLFYVNKKLSSGKIAISDKILASTQNGLSIIDPDNNEINNYSSLDDTNIHNIFSVDDDILIHTENGIYIIESINKETLILEKISNTIENSKIRIINNNEFILYTPSSNIFKRIIKFKNNYTVLDVSIPREFRINDIKNY